jgi:hypothetical protein
VVLSDVLSIVGLIVSVLSLSVGTAFTIIVYWLSRKLNFRTRMQTWDELRDIFGRSPWKCTMKVSTPTYCSSTQTATRRTTTEATGSPVTDTCGPLDLFPTFLDTITKLEIYRIP